MPDLRSGWAVRLNTTAVPAEGSPKAVSSEARRSGCSRATCRPPLCPSCCASWRTARRAAACTWSTPRARLRRCSCAAVRSMRSTPRARAPSSAPGWSAAVRSDRRRWPKRWRRSVRSCRAGGWASCWSTSGTSTRPSSRRSCRSNCSSRRLTCCAGRSAIGSSGSTSGRVRTSHRRRRLRTCWPRSPPARFAGRPSPMRSTGRTPYPRWLPPGAPTPSWPSTPRRGRCCARSTGRGPSPSWPASAASRFSRPVRWSTRWCTPVCSRSRSR